MSAQVFVSPLYVDGAYPHIMHHSHSATVTAASAVNGTVAEWVADGQTWNTVDVDNGGSAAYVEFDFGGAVEVNYIGLCALSMEGAVRVEFQTASGGAFAENTLWASEASDTGLHTVAWLFPRQTVYGVRIASDLPFSVGVIKAGISTVFPRLSTYTGTPISEAKKTTYTHQRSLTGQVLSSVTRGASTPFEVPIMHLSEDFRRSDAWGDFIDHVTRSTAPSFFAVPKPEKYPEDMRFGVCSERPQFVRNLPNKQVAGDVTISVIGYDTP